jgi:hypothetical protein
MNVWQWVYAFEMRALEAGDFRRARLCQMHNEAYAHRQSQPRRMLEILEEGRREAIALQEPWWVLFFEHWKLETQIYYLEDYREVIEMGIRQTLELNKPNLEQHPLRFGVYCNLVAAYLCVDPRGYADAIEQALAYLQTCVPESGGECYLLQARRHWFAYELGDYEAAFRLAQEELDMAFRDADIHTARHHAIDTYKALCWICAQRKEWENVRQYAELGIELVEKEDTYQYEFACFLAWWAVWLRREGAVDRARRAMQQALTIMGRLGIQPGEPFYDARAEYHQLGQEWEQIRKIREQEFSSSVGKGQLAYECRILLKQLEVAVQCGDATQGIQKQLEEGMKTLRAPSWFRAEMQRILKR